MISYQNIEQAALRVMENAAIDIPEDYRSSLAAMAADEDNELSCFVLNTMLDNYAAATADRRPMCADTGLPRYYVKVGNEARRFPAVSSPWRRPCAQATARSDPRASPCAPTAYTP